MNQSSTPGCCCIAGATPPALAAAVVLLCTLLSEVDLPAARPELTKGYRRHARQVLLSATSSPSKCALHQLLAGPTNAAACCQCSAAAPLVAMSTRVSPLQALRQLRIPPSACLILFSI